MNKEKVESFIKPGIHNNTVIDTHFKGRSPVTGLFICVKGLWRSEIKKFPAHSAYVAGAKLVGSP
ncbi:MAG: hypothetical protein KF862_11170 [Chitinophagaceae bacterium]|nr:hypothetical protein [Chitinophagaceae bacterium]